MTGFARVIRKRERRSLKYGTSHRRHADTAITRRRRRNTKNRTKTRKETAGPSPHGYCDLGRGATLSGRVGGGGGRAAGRFQPLARSDAKSAAPARALHGDGRFVYPQTASAPSARRTIGTLDATGRRSVLCTRSSRRVVQRVTPLWAPSRKNAVVAARFPILSHTGVILLSLSLALSHSLS